MVSYLGNGIIKKLLAEREIIVGRGNCFERDFIRAQEA